MKFIAHLAVARRGLVLAFAVLVTALAAFWGAGVEKNLSNGGFQDPASESMRVDAILARDFGTGPPNLVLIVAGRAGQAVDDPAVDDAARALTERVRAFRGVVSAESYWTAGEPAPLRADDGRSGLVLVRLGGDEDAYRATAEKLAPIIQDHALDIRTAGMAQVSVEVEKTTAEDLLRAELIVAPVTLVLLVLIFGSAIAALLPLVVGAVSVVSTTAVLQVLTELTPVSVFAMNVTTALGLGLAIDYSLFMVGRFRDELDSGAGVRDAVATTVRTAGRTVAFSAITVALSLSALLVFPLYFFRSIAYGGIAVVLLAALTSVVVLPALLALLGHRVNRYDVLARVRRRRAGGFWHRLALAVMRRPIPVAAAVIALLVLLGSPFLSVSFGLTDDRVLPKDSPAHQASQVLRDRFDTREAAAIPVVMPGYADRAGLHDYATKLSAMPGVARVDAPTGFYMDGRPVAPPAETSKRLIGPAGSWMSVVPDAEPYSAQGTDLVERIRSAAAPAVKYVGGQAAFLVDTKKSIGDRLPMALLVIAATTFALLFLFTGSVIIPIKAVLLNLLSLTATFGAMVYVFQDGNLRWLVGDFTVTGMVDATIPVLMFCVAFGLSMDYEVFLLSRIREEYLRTGDNTRAVAMGLEKTGRIVSAAAVLIAAVLLAFATSGITLLKLLGLGLALAVIVDATLVRGLLVPAFMRLAGRANWWAPPGLRWLHTRIGLREEEAPPVAERKELVSIS
ncbi:MMPL family transporter [Nonomuraea basaltis]|uniref:MMPL family transporter n=1 Tax=Nonomuraea basaltis TaxID=2495887 RepID=UPI00110C46BA|nr:MMPL family transporter [Nonomuraea basaltis]TMR95765.1 MMPL family transporter [Nonomuraea basaltis]